MSVYKMSTAQVMMFVKLYRDAECLWKIDSDEYKNRESRNKALKAISDKMKIDGFGAREVAQKIKNIRSAYYQELKKANNSNKSGSSADDIYQPKVVWFQIVHSFLKKDLEMNETESNSYLQVPSTSNQLGNGNIFLEKNSERPIGKFKSPPVLHQPSSLKKRRLQDSSSPPPYIGEAINKLECIQTNVSFETEFDVWSRSLAKQLNNMETWRALKLQMQIQNLVSQERIHEEQQKYNLVYSEHASNVIQPESGCSSLLKESESGSECK